MMPSCPLCHHTATEFYENQRKFYQCTHCRGVFVDPAQWPSGSKEMARYKTHNNDVHDPGYQKFVSPITNHILEHFKPTAAGLDYGAGPGPVITKMLRDQGYQLNLYDPYFAPEATVLKQKYDYIVCCEVIEHFHHPADEFKLLHGLLRANGQLVCMTDLYHDALNFDKWYYKNDETHVFFYHQQSLQYISAAFGFSDLTVEGRLIVFHA